MSTDHSESLFNCGCAIAVIVFNLLLGGWSVTYLLANLFDKTIPFLTAMLVGLFAGELTVPGAVVVWLLKSVGVL